MELQFLHNRLHISYNSRLVYYYVFAVFTTLFYSKLRPTFEPNYSTLEQTRALTNTGKNYSVTEQELLALVSAISYFHIYLANSTSDVYTDHKALTWLNSIKHTELQFLHNLLHISYNSRLIPEMI
jgi:hypothetical protein